MLVSLGNRVNMIKRLLQDLTPEQAEQAHEVLIRATDLELSAIWHKRSSIALGWTPLENS